PDAQAEADRRDGGRNEGQGAELMASLGRRLVSEGLGTAFLLAALVGSGIMAERLAGGNIALALLCNTIPTGAILVVLILTFGPLSGAHFNPSLAFALRRELNWGCAGFTSWPNSLARLPAYGPLTRCSSCRSGRLRRRRALALDSGSPS